MELSAYQGCVTSCIARFRILISGIIPILYTIIKKESPCVTPSLQCRVLAILLLFRKNEQWPVTISVEKKRASDGHKCLTVHSIPTRPILLTAFFSSTSKKSHSSVDKFSSHRALTPYIAQSIPALIPKHSWSYWHPMLSSGPVNLSKILAKIHSHFSPTVQYYGLRFD